MGGHERLDRRMIHIVATAVKSGKGGISTALVGFCEADILKDAGINIIESHNGQTSKLSSFRQAAKRIKSDVEAGDIVWLHCARWFSMLRKYLLARIAKRKGAKVYFQFHTLLTPYYTDTFLGRLLLKRLYSMADGICVVSDWWRTVLVRKLGFDTNRIHVVPNPLDDNFTELARSESYRSPKPESIRLLAMTRLVEGKNVAAVIDSLAFLPEQFHLTIAGDGPLSTSLQKRAHELGLADRVQFVGWINYQDKIALLQQQDLFVLPSQYDSFGMGFLEAMAVGVPVVALRTGPTADVVPHNQAGLLVDDCKAESLATAIKSALANHERLSRAARKHALSAYSTEIILPELLSFFERRGR